MRVSGDAVGVCNLHRTNEMNELTSLLDNEPIKGEGTVFVTSDWLSVRRLSFVLAAV